MEFNCPACAAPHAFPDDQVPSAGIVVACTRCGAHITLGRSGVVGAQTLASAEVEEEDHEPPAPEATVGMMSPLAESPLPSVPAKPAAPPPGPAVAPPGPSAAPPGPSAPAAGPSAPPEQPAEPAPSKAATKAAAKAAKAAAKASKSATPEAAAEDDGALGRTAAEGSGLFKAARKAMAAAREGFDSAANESIGPEVEVAGFPSFGAPTGPWTWRDLPQAFTSVLNLRRVILATVAFWAALIAYGLLGWVGGILGGLWGPLGSLFSLVALAGFVGAAALVSATLGYVVYQTVIERKPANMKAGLAWAKGSIKSVVGTPLAFVAAMVAVAVVQFAVGMVGRIPFAGPIVWGAVSPITVALSLAAGAVGVALLYALPIYIPVIYNEKTGPKETVLRLRDLFLTHRFQLVGLLMGTLAVIGVAFLVVVWPLVTIAARVGFAGVEAGFGMENLGKVLMGMPAGMGMGLPGPGGGGIDVPFQFDIAGLLFGIGSALGPAFVLALLALVYYTAGAIIYCIVTGRSKETV